MSAVAVIPARGGSKGLPRKNLQRLGGLTLLEHAVRLARLCPELDETAVSTDDPEIAETAAALGVRVVERPEELAADDTPMWPVLRHALDDVDPQGTRYEVLVLLEPTNPLRSPGEVAGVAEGLRGRHDLDGVVTVSEPRFNPIWQSVVERGGVLEPLLPDADRFERRQDVPRTLYVNGNVYAWRTSFVRSGSVRWQDGRTGAYETPELTSVSIDTAEDLALCELLLQSGRAFLPWLAEL